MSSVALVHCVGMSNDILVLGGTGKTGRRVVERLVAAGAPVRSAARHPEPARPGVRPVTFDWAEPATHVAALDGAAAVYVIPPAFVVDHADASAAFFQLAAARGVGRVVLLSARGVDADDAIPLRRAELALLATPGLDATVIRPTWFAQNFTEGVFADGVAAGVLAAPAGRGRVPFVDADDIADVAATLLLDGSGRFGGATLDLSGPVALSFDEAAAVLAARLGHDVRYLDLPPDEFVAGAVAAGVPADYAALLAALFEVVRNGWDEHTSDGVPQVLGRPARPFDAWADHL